MSQNGQQYRSHPVYKVYKYGLRCVLAKTARILLPTGQKKLQCSMPLLGNKTRPRFFLFSCTLADEKAQAIGVTDVQTTSA